MIGNATGTPVLSLLSRSRKASAYNFDKVRLVHDATNADSNMALEVHITTSNASCVFEIYENYSENGWFPTDWTSGEIPTGFSACELDFTTHDYVMATATDNNASNAFGVLYDGTIMSKENVELENTKALQIKDTSDTLQDTVQVDASDNTIFGNTNQPSIIESSTHHNIMMGQHSEISNLVHPFRLCPNAK